MNNNKNFLDQLDGGWEDLIADTYKDVNYENLVEFPLTRRDSKYFNVFINKHLSKQCDGKRILDIIIPDIETIKLEVKKVDISYSELYYVNFHFVPLKDVVFRLEDGLEMNPSTPEAIEKDVSFGLIISQNKRSGDIDYQISMSEYNVFSRFDVENATKHTFVPINLIDMYSDPIEPIKLKTSLRNRLIDEGLKL